MLCAINRSAHALYLLRNTRNDDSLHVCKQRFKLINFSTLNCEILKILDMPRHAHLHSAKVITLNREIATRLGTPFYIVPRDSYRTSLGWKGLNLKPT